MRPRLWRKLYSYLLYIRPCQFQKSLNLQDDSIYDYLLLAAVVCKGLLAKCLWLYSQVLHQQSSQLHRTLDGSGEQSYCIFNKAFLAIVNIHLKKLPDLLTVFDKIQSHEINTHDWELTKIPNHVSTDLQLPTTHSW